MGFVAADATANPAAGGSRSSLDEDGAREHQSSDGQPAVPAFSHLSAEEAAMRRTLKGDVGTAAIEAWLGASGIETAAYVIWF